MAVPSAKLATGIAKVCRLCHAPATNETLVDEAWDALKAGIVSAQKNVEAFNACSEEEVDSVLAFLAQRGTKRRSARGRVNECLRIVLSSASWLQRAQRHESKASLQELLAGNAELLEKLDPAVEEPDVSVEAEEEEEEAAPAEADAAPQPCGVRQRLAYGCQVMEGFGWRFPRDPVGTKLDEATEGFQSLFQGVTALTTPTGRASVDGDVGLALAELEGRWEGLLRFLLSMHTSGVRGAYASRIRFVVVNLRLYSLEFRHLAPWRSLPWGREPVPAAEAADEARRQREEEEDRRLASELQSREEAMVLTEAADMMLSEEEARRLGCQEDSSLARALQGRFDEAAASGRAGEAAAAGSKKTSSYARALQERFGKAAASGHAGKAAAAGRKKALAGGS